MVAPGLNAVMWRYVLRTHARSGKEFPQWDSEILGLFATVIAQGILRDSRLNPAASSSISCETLP
jgi:hypothetical protein